MERIRIVSIGIIIVFCIGIVPLHLNETYGTTEKACRENTFQVAEDVHIYSNEDWESQGWLGNGTEANPYKIENLTISVLAVANSDVFFIVQNCSITGSARLSRSENGCIQNCSITGSATLSGFENGSIRNCNFDEGIRIIRCQQITLSNLTGYSFHFDTCNNTLLTNFSLFGKDFAAVSVNIETSRNVTIERCHFEDVDIGVFVSDSTECTIQMNEFVNCAREGIILETCTECSVSRNKFRNCARRGFEIENSEHIDVVENFCEGEHYSPTVTNSEDCIILNNNLTLGVNIWGSQNLNISGNELGSLGLVVSHGYFGYFHHIVVNNTLEGKPLLYIVQETDTGYTGEYGQIIVAESTNLTFENIVSPRFLLALSESCVLSNVKSRYVKIENCYRVSVHNSENNGIDCQNSSETVINNNTVTDSYYGIKVWSGSARTIIANNSVLRIGGIAISISSPDVRIENNLVAYCPKRVSACTSPTTTPTYDDAGIKIRSNNCYIVNNTVITNAGYGIWIIGNNNTIYKNKLAGNFMGNGYSEGEDNQWDNGIDTGNYWGDWNQLGAYLVPGDEGCVDRFPNGYVNGTIDYGSPIPSLIIISSAIGCTIVIVVVVIKIYRRRQ